MLTFIIHMMCFVGGFILLLFLIVLSYTMLTPVMLRIDTRSKLYIITFPGGRINYQELEGKKGIEYTFLYKKGFYSFKQILLGVKKEKEEKKEDKKEDKIEEKIEKIGKAFEEEEKDKGKSFGEKLKILTREKTLIKQVLKKFFRFLTKVFRCITIRRVDGTFSMKEPYHFGLCCAILYPLTRRNFSLTPNFQGSNYLLADLFILPGKVVWRLIGFLLSLPLWKIYRLVKEIK
ncbi:MAG: hypothetical protein K8T10_18775 [Candidatus Eremiobacteraeota bacterium]|nr:hypothetical protein [Candidatus Eremiobacteraeota bacterium]